MTKFFPKGGAAEWAKGKREKTKVRGDVGREKL